MSTTTQREATVTIPPPNMQLAVFRITGTAPLMMAAFSQKAIESIKATQSAGTTARSRKKREARDFKADVEGSLHRTPEGWVGIPAVAFRAAMISACRLVGFKMTVAKLAIFIEADGFDAVSGQPLVRLDAGDYETVTLGARNANGNMDLRVRPLWRKWGAEVRVSFDGDQFTLDDVANLLARAGMQVGILEGRPDARQCVGLGYGTFRIGTSS